MDFALAFPFLVKDSSPSANFLNIEVAFPSTGCLVKVAYPFGLKAVPAYLDDSYFDYLVSSIILAPIKKFIFRKYN